MNLPTEILNGRYQLEQQIGQGGYGQIFLATDLLQGKKIVLKKNYAEDEESKTRFFHEARLLARLSHTHLPKVDDYFTTQTDHYLVMDYIPGKSLRAIVDEQGKLSLVQLRPWLADIISAVSYLHTHENPIIHRDIKPENILLVSDDDAFLVDFGTAKPTRNTESGEARIVSRGYSSPEQYRSITTDVRSDIYSLGALIYFALTGKNPPESYQRTTDIEDSTIPSIIIQAMALNPAHRPSSVKEIYTALYGESAEEVASQTVQYDATYVKDAKTAEDLSTATVTYPFTESILEMPQPTSIAMVQVASLISDTDDNVSLIDTLHYALKDLLSNNYKKIRSKLTSTPIIIFLIWICLIFIAATPIQYLLIPILIAFGFYGKRIKEYWDNPPIAHSQNPFLQKTSINHPVDIKKTQRYFDQLVCTQLHLFPKKNTYRYSGLQRNLDNANGLTVTIHDKGTKREKALLITTNQLLDVQSKPTIQVVNRTDIQLIAHTAGHQKSHYLLYKNQWNTYLQRINTQNELIWEIQMDIPYDILKCNHNNLLVATSDGKIATYAFNGKVLQKWELTHRIQDIVQTRNGNLLCLANHPIYWLIEYDLTDKQKMTTMLSMNNDMQIGIPQEIAFQDQTKTIFILTRSTKTVKRADRIYSLKEMEDHTYILNKQTQKR